MADRDRDDHDHAAPGRDDDEAGLGDEGGLRWDPGSIETDANHVVTNFAIDDLVSEVLTTDEPRNSQTWQLGGHIDWRATDRLEFTAGLRFTRESITSGYEARNAHPMTGMIEQMVKKGVVAGWPGGGGWLGRIMPKLIPRSPEGATRRRPPYTPATTLMPVSQPCRAADARHAGRPR